MVDDVISVGVVTPHAAAGPEAELPDMAAGRVVTQVARIPAPDATGADPGTPPTSPSGLRALTAPSTLDAAVATFTPGSIDVIGYASTSSGYAIGFEAETTLVKRLSQRWNLPATATCPSAVAALRALNVERVALVHPPWFVEEFNELGARYFRSQGFTVVDSRLADLPDDPRRIEPGAIVEWISGHLSDDAEAVFIGGNGLRAAGAIEPLEQQIGRPVLESNQVMLWSTLASVQATFKVSGFGMLFDQTREGYQR